MWLSEVRHQNRFEEEGWTILRNGYPDFLLLKRDKNWKISEVKFVESKGYYDGVPAKLRWEQEKMHKILRELGFTVEVLYD